jgi:hypothetical protein
LITRERLKYFLVIALEKKEEEEDIFDWQVVYSL